MGPYFFVIGILIKTEVFYGENEGTRTSSFRAEQ